MSKYNHISKILFKRNYDQLNKKEKKEVRKLYKESEQEWQAESEVS